MKTKRYIRKVAVLGAGNMGARIACHFANVGVSVLLLDVAKEGGKESASHRDAVAKEQLLAAIQGKPPALYSEDFACRIATGNFAYDLPKINGCDWIVEAVVEEPTIKRTLLAQVDTHRREDSIVSSNTSSIPLRVLSEGRSRSFCAHFCGTHFFNPPRYLRLLEVIPTAQTSREVVDFLMHYGQLFLGKEPILCKDTPAFVANRIGIYGILSVIRAAQEMGFSFAQTDALTGTLIGRPKSATFRTLDVVGVDVMAKVISFLQGTLSNDPHREHFALPAVIAALDKKRQWGEKTKQGFYKKVKQDGHTKILQWNTATRAYEPYEKPRFDALRAAKKRALAERLQELLMLSDKVGDFYRRTFYELFAYAAWCIPAVADAIHTVDSAFRAGFGWTMGPFQVWEALGVSNTIAAMRKADMTLPDWVLSMAKRQSSTFYERKAGEQLYYDVPKGKMCALPGSGVAVGLPTRGESIVWSNRDVTLRDMGDEVLQLAFCTKMNTLNAAVVEGIEQALQLGEERFCGLVIANEAEHFSAGADLSLVYAHACEQNYEEIEEMVRQFQQMTMRLRSSPLPVVVAVSGMVLGGGCELSLHADTIVAHTETYMGLVESGVGLIPAGGGTKEMALRLSLALQEGDPVLNRLLHIFQPLALAKVSQSAHHARRLGFIRDADPIVIDATCLVRYAKEEVLRWHRRGYTPAAPAQGIKVQGRTGIAFLETAITNMLYGRYATAHDAKVARKLSHVINGGALPSPAEVSEYHLLDLEREAFLSLCGEQKTLERMHSLLFGKKILRN